MKKYFAIAVAMVCMMMSFELANADILRTNKAGKMISNPNESADLLQQRMSEYEMVSFWAITESDALEGKADVDLLREGVIAMASLREQTQDAIGEPECAFELLDEQIQAGKLFVEGADLYLKNHSNSSLAAVRDVVASFCLQNALVSANDAEIDYWANVEALVEHNEMVYVLQ